MPSSFSAPRRAAIRVPPAVADPASAFAERGCRSSDANLRGYLTLRTRTARDGVVDNRDGVLLFSTASRYPGPFCNGVLRWSDGVEDAELLERARAFFGPRERAFVVWVRDHADSSLGARLLAEGFTERQPAGGLQALAADAPLTVPGPLPTDCRIEQVRTAEGFGDYLDVAAEAWQLADAPRPVAEDVLFPLASLAEPDMRAYVLYRGERALAICSLFLSAEAGGLQWIGIRPEASGQRLARHAVAHAAAASFDAGRSMLVVQASRQGTPVWTGMGLRRVSAYHRFLSPAALAR
jgi:hypothetical protein